MVTLNKIYTKKGDDGTTALGSLERVVKDHPRINAYGSVDELNASLGILVALLQNDEHPESKTIAELLSLIQNDLFDIGADLAVPQKPNQTSSRALIKISLTQVTKIEQEINLYNKKLKPLKSFVLPGGHQIAAYMHQARTICRRAEREVVKLYNQPEEYISITILKYLNRLSDLIFVLSRFVNELKQTHEQLWIPQKNK